MRKFLDRDCAQSGRLLNLCKAGGRGRGRQAGRLLPLRHLIYCPRIGLGGDDSCLHSGPRVCRAKTEMSASVRPLYVAAREREGQILA